ncbi:hypothetical protein AMECASPLE_039431 [Ameca splendens]|uniref:Uncharacterized protein n=1 Tax=Ameca splendens TaxID=208324 RepID=A0ABV0YJI8_9TELE
MVCRGLQLSQTLQTTKPYVAFRLAQEQGVANFMGWVPVAEQLHPSHTSTIVMKRVRRSSVRVYSPCHFWSALNGPEFVSPLGPDLLCRCEYTQANPGPDQTTGPRPTF